MEVLYVVLGLFALFGFWLAFVFALFTYLDGRKRGLTGRQLYVEQEGILPSLCRLGVKHGRRARQRNNVKDRIAGRGD